MRQHPHSTRAWRKRAVADKALVCHRIRAGRAAGQSTPRHLLRFAASAGERSPRNAAQWDGKGREQASAWVRPRVAVMAHPHPLAATAASSGRRHHPRTTKEGCGHLLARLAPTGRLSGHVGFDETVLELETRCWPAQPGSTRRGDRARPGWSSPSWRCSTNGAGVRGFWITTTLTTRCRTLPWACRRARGDLPIPGGPGRPLHRELCYPRHLGRRPARRCRPVQGPGPTLGDPRRCTRSCAPANRGVSGQLASRPGRAHPCGPFMCSRIANIQVPCIPPTAACLSWVPATLSTTPTGPHHPPLRTGRAESHPLPDRAERQVALLRQERFCVRSGITCEVLARSAGTCASRPR